MLGFLLGQLTDIGEPATPWLDTQPTPAIRTRVPESGAQNQNTKGPSAAPEVGSSAPITQTSALQTSPRSPISTSATGAEQRLEASIEQQDFEAIWQLAFDLIASGHFEEVDRLYEKFADAFHGGDLNSPLWKTPDFYSGNLMREYADN